MTAAVKLAPVAPVASGAPRTVSPFPSTQALALEQTPMHELEKVFQRGATPNIDDLLGWEFRGINHLPLNRVPVATLVGIKKFLKGFFRDESGKVRGYNMAAKMNVLDGRWHLTEKRYGYFETDYVDATARDNTYLHAVLLDYSKGGNPALYPMNVLRDYIVQVDPSNPDLFLGKAYIALGPARIPTNFFILERHRRGLTDYAQR